MSAESLAPETAEVPSTADVSTSSAIPESTPAQPEFSKTPPIKPGIAPFSTADPSKKTRSSSGSSSLLSPDTLSSEPDFVTIPSYSRWFAWNNIHECEIRLMPEFFDARSPSKNPSVYKYYRNEIVKKFRENPSRKIAFTEVRRTLVGDVGSIRRVFDFLETWGLINYSPSGKQALRLEEKENKSSIAATPPSQANDVAATEAAVLSNGERSKKLCSACKSLCSIACFVCDKYGLVLCARCYVRGNYRVGVNSSEFRRVEISEPAKTDWTDKETLHLLEAITRYGDDWMRVAEHVSGRSEKECVACFIKLPFGEQFMDPADPGEDASVHEMKDHCDAESIVESSGKRVCITPLADASNPIMAQAAFLSALAGVDIGEAAAQAAVTAVYDMDHVKCRANFQPPFSASKEQEAGTTSSQDSAIQTSGEAQTDPESLLGKEEHDLERAISSIAEVQMPEIQYELIHYEVMELQLEKEWQQLNQMNNQLFLDQLALLFHMAAVPKSEEISVEESGR
ncbi:hypothetical protein Nepgr_010443 [Nepenthes gracilis]|uniref:SWI/SNF complex subunit SWI3B n=1 Tax=Nepenthes gracilis TaxID=150966 RepID=A0AAD3SCK1_NEPGR|nr:hypothetical protein Nepgr_010443 [Nepenthes gracilis]